MSTDARYSCSWSLLIQWLERALDARGMSPTDLVRAADIPSGTLSGLMTCKHKPQLGTVYLIARYFQQSLDDLWAMVEPENQPLPQVSILGGISQTLLVPIISHASAGGGSLVPEGFEVVAPIRGASRNLIAVAVPGWLGRRVSWLGGEARSGQNWMGRETRPG